MCWYFGGQVRSQGASKGRRDETVSQYKEVSPLSGPSWDDTRYGAQASLSSRRKKAALSDACILQWSKVHPNLAFSSCHIPWCWVDDELVLCCVPNLTSEEKTRARSEMSTERAWGEALCIATCVKYDQTLHRMGHRVMAEIKDRGSKGTGSVHCKSPHQLFTNWAQEPNIK